MAFTKLTYTKNWENPDDFPTVETDERVVRRDQQLLYDEIKAHLNEVLTAEIVEALAAKATNQDITNVRTEMNQLVIGVSPDLAECEQVLADM